MDVGFQAAVGDQLTAGIRFRATTEGNGGSELQGVRHTAEAPRHRWRRSSLRHESSDPPLPFTEKPLLFAFICE